MRATVEEKKQNVEKPMICRSNLNAKDLGNNADRLNLSCAVCLDYANGVLREQYVKTWHERTKRGTVGQPDAVWSRGGEYELLGGFWPRDTSGIIVFDELRHWQSSG